MRRIISLLIVLVMVLSLAPASVFAEEGIIEIHFTDISDNHYCAKAAKTLGALGILKGYLDGSFGPEKTITRAEMATVVCRMIQREEDSEYTVGKTQFKDVLENHWASGFINIASRHKIINGYGNGEFRPENQVSFEEAIKMVICALGYDKEVTPDPEDWAAPYLKVAEKHGISNGLKGHRGQVATRGDVALMTYNAMDSGSAHSKIPATPTPVLDSGEYKGKQTVKITTATLFADIYYSTDGSDPVVSLTTKYTKPIVITETTTIKAIAVKNGIVSSSIMTAEYIIK